MNVFLGFYIPNEMLVPLWDLDSDYYLHNRISRPPTPYINRILYEENRINTNSLEALKGAGRVVNNVAFQTPEWTLRQEGVAKKYFINSQSLPRRDLPLDLREETKRLSSKSILLRSDYPLLFHDEDHDEAPPLPDTLSERTCVEEEKEPKLERLLILDAIESSEQRKVRVRAIERKIEEASQMWWREAVHDFKARRQWMLLPPPGTGLARPYFE